MRLSACQYLLHQSFVEGSVKGESLNAGTLCSQFVTTAFSLTIFMVLIFLAAQTMDMCVSLENEQDHHYGHMHCRKHVFFHKHGLDYAEEVNGEHFKCVHSTVLDTLTLSLISKLCFYVHFVTDAPRTLWG